MKIVSKISKVAQRTLWGALGTFMLLFISMGEARATHLAAADIDAQFIGPRPQQGFCGAFQTEYRYILTIRIYRACEAGATLGPFDGGYTVRSPSNCNATVISGTAAQVAIDTLDQLCEQFKDQSACRLTSVPENYPYPGFIRHTYVDTVSLPSACPDWTFAWTSGARNNGVTNLDLSKSNLYVACMVNNVVSPTNSSPRFTADPIPFICINKASYFINGPADADGDSISVVSTAAQNGYNDPINYLPPYTATNPINSSTGYTVNSRTGTATFTTPGVQGKIVLSYRANEYNSSGVLLGYADRDIQVVTLPCVTAPPIIDSVPSSIVGANIIRTEANNTLLTVCPGTEVKFNVNGSSATSTAVLLLQVNNDKVAKSSTLTVTGGLTNNVSGEFKWTPTKADIGSNTLIFTLVDSSCNVSGQSILQRNNMIMSIFVPGDIDAGPDGFSCPNPGSIPYTIKATSPTQTTYTWSTVPGGSSANTLSCQNCLNPEARPDVPTQYILEASPSPYLCKLRDTVFVNANVVKITQGPEQVLCRPSTLALNAVAVGLPPRQIITCGGTTVATCATPDSATIGNCTNASTGTSETLTPFYTYYATQKSQILYRKEDLRANGVLPQTLKRIAFFVDATNSATPLSNFNISLKCTQRQNMSVQGSLNFEQNATNVFVGGAPVVLKQGWNYFTLNKDFNYDTTQNLLVEICFANTSSSYQAAAAVQYSPTSYVSVLQRNYFSGNVCSNTATGYTFSSTPNRPNMRLFGCLPTDLPFEYKWTPGDFLVDSFGANTSAYVPQSIKYYVEVEGIEGCTVRDSINIIVPTDTITVSPMDSLICPGELAIIQATQSPYESYQWYEGDFQKPTTLDCETCARVLARPVVDTRYTVVGTINYGNLIRVACPDTAFADVRVRPAAIINVTPEDTLIKSGQRVILTATGGESYTWTPVSKGLNTNTGPRVLAQPLESTMFIVEGLDTNGCRGSDTANVRIDYRQALFVPTAFTPNNDGNNDVFGVVNLSVQKIIEFRVFNRWGQEIFSTTDARQGWDGTWKATPQPTGSYNYIIRVAYPDGITDTFKGEVTLIR